MTVPAAGSRKTPRIGWVGTLRTSDRWVQTIWRTVNGIPFFAVPETYLGVRPDLADAGGFGTLPHEGISG